MFNSSKTTVSLQTMFIGVKIKNLVKARGLLLKNLTELWGIQPHHFSRMIKEKLVFNDKKVAIASEFLGVSETYLRDETRPFKKGDKIPEDVLIAEKPAPPPAAPTDLVELARSMERQAADIARSEMERMKIEMDAIRESNRQMAQIMNEALGKLAYIADVVKDIKDERDGSHDPD